MSFCIIKPENQYCSHFFLLYCWLSVSEDTYTHQTDVFHDIQPNADQGQDISLISQYLYSHLHHQHRSRKPHLTSSASSALHVEMSGRHFCKTTEGRSWFCTLSSCCIWRKGSDPFFLCSSRQNHWCHFSRDCRRQWGRRGLWQLVSADPSTDQTTAVMISASLPLSLGEQIIFLSSLHYSMLWSWKPARKRTMTARLQTLQNINFRPDLNAFSKRNVNI